MSKLSERRGRKESRRRRKRKELKKLKLEEKRTFVNRLFGKRVPTA